MNESDPTIMDSSKNTGELLENSDASAREAGANRTKSILDASFNSIMDTTTATEPLDTSMISNNNDVSFSAVSESDIISDVFDEITELATGLAYKLFPDAADTPDHESPERVQSNRDYDKKENGVSVSLVEEEDDDDEPGKIVSSFSTEVAEDQPFDEDGLSAMARMRYKRGMLQETPIDVTKSTQMESLGKEKSEKLKLKNPVSKGDNDEDEAIHEYGRRKNKKDRSFDWEESLNMITQPVSDALMSTKQTFMGLIKTFKDDESVGSGYDGSDADDFSEYSGKSDVSDDNDDTERDDASCAPTRQSKSKSSVFLHRITNEGIRLIYYLPVHAVSAVHDSSIPVKMFIQISYTEEDIEPKLVWEVRGNLSPRRKKKLHPRMLSNEALSLFDISSVQMASESINIDSFPDAEAENSILITMNDGTVHLLEAESTVDARNVVHGLRWIIARLTFNIIVGNVSVVADMLSIDDGDGPNELSVEVMHSVTAQLVKKSSSRLDSVQV